MVSATDRTSSGVSMASRMRNPRPIADTTDRIAGMPRQQRAATVAPMTPEIGRASCRERGERQGGAEDGIRYLTVTGVQTCALPIWFLIRDAILTPLRVRRW